MILEDLLKQVIKWLFVFSLALNVASGIYFYITVKKSNDSKLELSAMERNRNELSREVSELKSKSIESTRKAQVMIQYVRQEAEEITNSSPSSVSIGAYTNALGALDMAEHANMKLRDELDAISILREADNRYFKKLDDSRKSETLTVGLVAGGLGLAIGAVVIALIKK